MNEVKSSSGRGKGRVVNFGCRLNAAESELIEENLQGLGLQDEVIVVNSCAVTKEAERQVRQTIRKLRRENPTARLLVTGCAAQINQELYKAMPEVDGIIDNQKKLQREEYAWLAGGSGEDMAAAAAVAAEDMAAGDPDPEVAQGGDRDQGRRRGRGSVQVQNGCNHRCTFCIIPYGRGPSQSLPLGDIVARTRAQLERGCGEIVLTGVDMTDYGSDLPGGPRLGSIIKRLLRLVPEIQRLRLSSVDVAEIDRDIIDLVANEPRFMPYFHISLQAGDDLILKRMKRRHTRQQVIDFCRQMRELRPDVAFGADVIAGFPTETEEMFENSRQLLEECDIVFCHVFPYSERDGTPAARMPQVDPAVRRRRAAILRQEGEMRLVKHYQRQAGRVISVVVEGPGRGRAEDFSLVRLVGAAGAAGSEGWREGVITAVTVEGFETAEGEQPVLRGRLLNINVKN